MAAILDSRALDQHLALCKCSAGVIYSTVTLLECPFFDLMNSLQFTHPIDTKNNSWKRLRWPLSSFCPQTLITQRKKNRGHIILFLGPSRRVRHGWKGGWVAVLPSPWGTLAWWFHSSDGSTLPRVGPSSCEFVSGHTAFGYPVSLLTSRVCLSILIHLFLAPKLYAFWALNLYYSHFRVKLECTFVNT